MDCVGGMSNLYVCFLNPLLGSTVSGQATIHGVSRLMLVNVHVRYLCGDR